MQCHQCQVELQQVTAICPSCGSALRAHEAPSQRKASKPSAAAIIWTILATLAMLIIVLIALGGNKGPSSSARSARSGRLLSDALCGEKRDVVAAILASKRDDNEAILGLVARGKIKTLKPETQFNVLSIEEPLALVRVTSGLQVNEKCWIPLVGVALD